MTARCILPIFLLLWPLISVAGELSTRLFAGTPAPAAVEFAMPRLLAIDPTSSCCYVLDSELARIVALTLDGEQVGVWSLESLGIETALQPDPILPIPALGIGGKTVYLLTLDRQMHLLDMAVLQGPGKSRTLALPDGASSGAVAVDDAGRALVAYLQSSGGKVTLTLAREGDDGEFTTVTSLKNPCNDEVKNLNLTGFAVAPDGRFAIGIAQNGHAAYPFVRSWLIQGTLKDGEVTQEMASTHRFSLLDGQGKVQERFRAAVTLAGRSQYPEKPCVPLFTSLAFGPDETIISGGHTFDPFLRVYGKDGALLRSIPRKATGGQHLATLPEKHGVRIFATSPAEKQISEYALDGRILSGFGAPLPYDLARPVSLAADHDSVYVAVRADAAFKLIRFAADGRFLWAQSLTPPDVMATATPFLAVTNSERVLIGWRMPRANGIGWVDTIMDDGMPGLPLWPKPFTWTTALPAPCPTPIITGGDNRVYLLRESKDGARLQSFSTAGAFMQQFPTEIQGITTVMKDGRLAWARADNSGMIIVPYTPQGEETGWKRIPRPAMNAQFLPTPTSEQWGWLTSTNTLLKLDDNLMVVDEQTVLGPDGSPVVNAQAVAGDREKMIYFALPGRILVGEL